VTLIGAADASTALATEATAGAAIVIRCHNVDLMGDVTRVLLAALGVATATGLAAAVHADPVGNDGAFLDLLHKAGITFQNPHQAIAAGKAACALMITGKSGPDVVDELQDRNPGFPPDAAAQFSAIAASVYCPQQLVDGGQAAQPELVPAD